MSNQETMRRFAYELAERQVYLTEHTRLSTNQRSSVIWALADALTDVAKNQTDLATYGIDIYDDAVDLLEANMAAAAARRAAS